MKIFYHNGCYFRFFFAYLVLAVSCSALSIGADANDPNNPKKLLQIKFDTIFSILQNKDLDQQTKEKQINEIVSYLFDFPLMAKLSLGRKHWPKLTKTQREKFTELFVKKLKAFYRKKISLYTNEKVRFKQISQKKKTTFVPVELVSMDKTVVMLYKFRKAGKRWKIYDVQIEGVSILLTYRSQFDDILSRGTVDDLLAQLEK